MIDFRSLVKAGVHFGHQTSRWSPRMAPYIWGAKNDVHLIDVSKTAVQLEKAAKFLETTVGEGKTVLWMGTKKPAQAIMKDAANALDMPYVTHRWIGGTLTNFLQVKKSITKYLHLQDVLKKSDKGHYTKKEFNVFQKLVDRLEKNIGGILNLKWPVGAIVVVDAKKERSGIKEANVMGIPVIGLVDTNTDPSGVEYVIPANDDSPRSIKVVIDYLVEAGQRGKKIAEENAAAAKADQELLKSKKEKEAAAKKVAAKPAPKKEAVKAAPKKAEAKKEAAPVKKAAPAKEAPSKPSQTAMADKKKVAPKAEAPKKAEVKKAADKK